MAVHEPSAGVVVLCDLLGLEQLTGSALNTICVLHARSDTDSIKLTVLLLSYFLIYVSFLYFGFR